MTRELTSDKTPRPNILPGLLLLVACSIPSEDDVRAATRDAIEGCERIIDDSLPRITAEVIGGALQACASIVASVDLTRDTLEAAVREVRELVAYDVLVALGCSWSGETWDCATVEFICDRDW